TASHVQYICPVHHFLESWNDAEPKSGSYSLAQPTIQHIFNTRHFQENLLKWSGNGQSYYDFIRSNWLTNIYPKSDSDISLRVSGIKSCRMVYLNLKTHLL
ncbi:MAG: hypothetical protein HC905_16910, partial [Bacteroidales bacterium]|nr:hypothetical protein [Bacteroidales bacterium]